MRQPKILILDEATANIDTETEEIIQHGLQQIRQGRTTIMIAHRLSTIKDADQIYVLRHGEIIEQGKHEDLIRQQGTYYRVKKTRGNLVFLYRLCKGLFKSFCVY